jgi:hypothetical protein
MDILIVKVVVEMEYVKHVLKINIKEIIVMNPAPIAQEESVMLMVLVLIPVLIVMMKLRKETSVILLVIMNILIVKSVIEMEPVQNVFMINLRKTIVQYHVLLVQEEHAILMVLVLIPVLIVKMKQ